jgi:BirA family transcriptional regulator, biotin operon repressor / biotin---[acetyl-CoA-carboxylase] ligase
MGPREYYEEIASTQDRAIELARQGAPAGTRVRASRQSHGRGRLDHRWESPPGGLWLSIVLPAPIARASVLPLAVGACLRRGLDARYSVQLRLKWPNDLLATGFRPARKLAGILVDRVASPNLREAAVVGIGLNVRVEASALPEEVRNRYVSLSDLVTPSPSIDEVEEIAATAALEASDAVASETGSDRVLADCRRALYGVGLRATVDGSIQGTIRGLGDEGELLLDNGLDRLTIRTGDLRLEEAA